MIHMVLYGPTLDFPLNLPPLDFYSPGVLAYHSNYARKAIKVTIWNIMNTVMRGLVILSFIFWFWFWHSYILPLDSSSLFCLFSCVSYFSVSYISCLVPCVSFFLSLVYSINNLCCLWSIVIAFLFSVSCLLSLITGGEGTIQIPPEALNHGRFCIL